MSILGLLGLYFDAAVVIVKTSSLLFRLALAIFYICLYEVQFHTSFIVVKIASLNSLLSKAQLYGG
jgi:hypothetical protein